MGFSSLYLAMRQSSGEVFTLVNAVSWLCDPGWDFYLSHRMASGKRVGRVWIA